MILLINPISENIELSVIDDVEVRHTHTIPRGHDYDEFPEVLIDTIDRQDIDTIWCITGPGAFTRMRIVTLAVNTVKLTRRITLKSCHFFDIVDSTSPILRANDREYIMKSPDSSTCLVAKDGIPHGIYVGYGDENDFTDGRKLIQYREDINHIKIVFDTLPSVKHISPIYLKDPHITWSKKSISPSSEKMKK